VAKFQNNNNTEMLERMEIQKNFYSLLLENLKLCNHLEIQLEFLTKLKSLPYNPTVTLSFLAK
jgi:hypothetical protein